MALYKVHQVRHVMIVLLCLFLSLASLELGRVADQEMSAQPTMNKLLSIAADELLRDEYFTGCFSSSGLFFSCSSLGKAWQELDWDAGDEYEEVGGGDGPAEIKGEKAAAAAAMVNSIRPSLEMSLSDDGVSAKELLLLVFPERSYSVKKQALNYRRFSNSGNFHNHFHYRAIPWQRKRRDESLVDDMDESEGSGGRGRPRRRWQAEELPIPTVTIEEHISERRGRERIVKFAVVAALMIWLIIFS